jgi:hypothetical protein
MARRRFHDEDDDRGQDRRPARRGDAGGGFLLAGLLAGAMALALGGGVMLFWAGTAIPPPVRPPAVAVAEVPPRF